MVLAGLALCFSLSQSNAQTTSGAAPSVVVAEVFSRDVTRRFDYVGRVEAIERVSLRARVQLLFVIEKAPYQIVVNNARRIWPAPRRR
jgi:multidrug efflux pump subunit AcrA (membrane-fusion protein)